jgi:hypothetical protein
LWNWILGLCCFIKKKEENLGIFEAVQLVFFLGSWDCGSYRFASCVFVPSFLLMFVMI